MLIIIVLVIILIALVFREAFDAKKKEREKIEADLKARTMPSGLILPKNPKEILAYKKADLIKWDKEDIKFLLSYIVYRRDDSASEDEYKSWNDLFYEASRALYDY